MVQKYTLTACLIGSCVLCLALVLRVDAAQEPAPSFKPVAPVGALMYGQGTMFKRIDTLLPKAGEIKSLHEMEEAAFALAELANVNRHNREDSDYRGWATQLRDTSLEFAAEAEKAAGADANKLKQLFETIKATCQSCHDKYQE